MRRGLVPLVRQGRRGPAVDLDAMLLVLMEQYCKGTAAAVLMRLSAVSAQTAVKSVLPHSPLQAPAPSAPWRCRGASLTAVVLELQHWSATTSAAAGAGPPPWPPQFRW